MRSTVLYRAAQIFAHVLMRLDLYICDAPNYITRDLRILG